MQQSNVTRGLRSRCRRRQSLHCSRLPKQHHMAATSGSPLPAIRAIARELRHSLGKQKISQEPAMQYILAQARVHDMTDGRVCRPVNELRFLANVYACYLNSNRRFNELQARYGSKEKSVEDAAKTVGLSVPKKPKD